MDAEVISASILRVVMESGGMTMIDVKTQIGATISHLLKAAVNSRRLGQRYFPSCEKIVCHTTTFDP